MKVLLKVFWVFVLVAMTWVTVIASLDRNVVVAFGEIWADPWGRATLFDAYFAFLAVYLWIFFREPSVSARIFWLVLILTLGNFAIAFYFLWALHRIGSGPWTDLFKRRPEVRT
jgi:Protein of unknown function (DUF1475)